MLDYIMKNKEWIFSGIGVSIIAGLFFAVKYVWQMNEKIKTVANTTGLPQPTANEIESQGVRSTDILQDDISRIVLEVENMPPLQLDDVRKNYIGLYVDWMTKYSYAYKKNGDIIRVSLTAITTCFHPINVNCEVSLPEYRQFSILKRNAKVRIIGTISKFDNYSFELSNVTLFFHNDDHQACKHDEQKQKYEHEKEKLLNS